MTLTVAMALCDMEAERANLEELFRSNSAAALPVSGRLPKSSSTLSLASSTGASSYYSVESGISSMSPDSLVEPDGQYQELTKTNFYQCDLLTQNPGESQFIYENMQSILGKLRAAKEEDERKRIKLETSDGARPKSRWSSVVIYAGRNLLDLNDNLRNRWDFRYAHLPEENRDRFYFENRSQYSRVQEAHPPECIKHVCNFECGFLQYFHT